MKLAIEARQQNDNLVHMHELYHNLVHKREPLTEPIFKDAVHTLAEVADTMSIIWNTNWTILSTLIVSEAINHNIPIKPDEKLAQELIKLRNRTLNQIEEEDKRGGHVCFGMGLELEDIKEDGLAAASRDHLRHGFNILIEQAAPKKSKTWLPPFNKIK